MFKKILTYIFTMVILIESTGLACLEPQAPQEDPCLRPMASAMLKDINKRLSPETERLIQEKSDNPYHPHNILATFKKGNLSWKSIPEKYLTRDIKILVKELAGLLEKDPYELKSGDFMKFVFLMPSGKKKSLYGLLIFIMNSYSPSTPEEAVSWIKKRLRIKRYLNPKYHPDNILATFKKGNLSWKSIPEKYLTSDIKILVKELAGLLEKDPYELKSRDFGKFVFLTPSGKKKCLSGLLDFIIDNYSPACQDKLSVN